MVAYCVSVDGDVPATDKRIRRASPQKLLGSLAPPEQTTAIEEALKKNWSLREKLSVLKTSMQRLDKIKETPRTEVVLNVLNYAKERSEQTV